MTTIDNIMNIVDGIDRDEANGGWWETSSGVQFGQGVKQALRAAIEQALKPGEPVCDKDPRGCWSVRCQLGKVCKNTAPQPHRDHFRDATEKVDDTALLRQALEALEFHSHGDDIDVLLIAALRERLK
jgi:hypothetical protein